MSPRRQHPARLPVLHIRKSSRVGLSPSRRNRSAPGAGRSRNRLKNRVDRYFQEPPCPGRGGTGFAIQGGMRRSIGEWVLSAATVTLVRLALLFIYEPVRNDVTRLAMTKPSAEISTRGSRSPSDGVGGGDGSRNRALEFQLTVFSIAAVVTPRGHAALVRLANLRALILAIEPARRQRDALSAVVRQRVGRLILADTTEHARRGRIRQPRTDLVPCPPALTRRTTRAGRGAARDRRAPRTWHPTIPVLAAHTAEASPSGLSRGAARTHGTGAGRLRSGGLRRADLGLPKESAAERASRVFDEDDCRTPRRSTRRNSSPRTCTTSDANVRGGARLRDRGRPGVRAVCAGRRSVYEPPRDADLRARRNAGVPAAGSRLCAHRVRR